MTTRERYEAFMAGLAKLTQEHDLEVAGCGCCRSPYIVDLRDGEEIAKALTWDSVARTYKTSEVVTEAEGA